MAENEYLYHYTSIETLALILKNKTIKFNNLLNVDDPEEAESEDLGNAGRHCLVSCWTNINEDIIPMWNMYTPNMKGVRIKMRKYPFKQYTYLKGELHFARETETAINFYGDYANKVTIPAECPLLESVEYTDDENLLKPTVKFESDGEIKIDYRRIGKYKRSYWKFQQEYRYKICTAPWSIEELEKVKTIQEHIQIFNRILDVNNMQYCDQIYLDLSDNAFDGMEILLAPKTTEAEFIIVESLLEKYCKGLSIKISKSKLRIR